MTTNKQGFNYYNFDFLFFKCLQRKYWKQGRTEIIYFCAVLKIYDTQSWENFVFQSKGWLVLKV